MSRGGGWRRQMKKAPYKNEPLKKEREGFLAAGVVGIGRILVSLLIPAVAFAVLYAGFIFLRDSRAGLAGTDFARPTGVKR